MLDDIQLDDGAAGMGHVRAHAALRTHGPGRNLEPFQPLRQMPRAGGLWRAG
jgi:hypothetical protein